MALAHHTPASPGRQPRQPHTVVTMPERNEIYDHKHTPLYALDAYLSGAPWEITAYFNQRLGEHDLVSQFDIYNPASLQSYNRIEKVRLMVQSALSTQYDAGRDITKVQGNSLLPSFMVPHINDVFIANSNLGRQGIFRVTDRRRLEAERESAYEIEYVGVVEVTSKDPILEKLYANTTEVFVHSVTRQIEGRTPILLKKEYDDLQNLHKQRKDLITRYFTDFFRPFESTLMVPGQEHRIHDPGLMQFLMQVVESSETPRFADMNLLSVNNEPLFQRQTLWDALMRRGANILEEVEPRFVLRNPRSMIPTPYARTAYYGNTEFLVQPYDLDLTVESESKWPAMPPEPRPYGKITKFARTRNTRKENDVPPLLENYYGHVSLPLYIPISSLDSYVFSESFYRNEPTSLVELLVTDYLQQAPINLQQLSRLLVHWNKLERLEQFYYGPIVVALMREIDRGVFV